MIPLDANWIDRWGRLLWCLSNAWGFSSLQFQISTLGYWSEFANSLIACKQSANVYDPLSQIPLQPHRPRTSNIKHHPHVHIYTKTKICSDYPEDMGKSFGTLMRHPKYNFSRGRQLFNLAVLAHRTFSTRRPILINNTTLTRFSWGWGQIAQHTCRNLGQLCPPCQYT